MGMLKVLIVDDEKYVRNELKYFLDKYDYIKVCGECDDGEEAIKLVKLLKPDIVFLDIHLQDMSGMVVARKILEIDKPPHIVFATAYEKYAIQGFELDAVDYILKPFLEERIKVTIDRIRERLKSQNVGINNNRILKHEEISLDKLCVIKGDKLILVDVREIQYIQSINNDIVVHTGKNFYNCNYSLKELEDKLRRMKFLRTHKSYIVNIDYIDEIIPWFNYTYKIKIRGLEDREVPVSRNYMKKFKRILGI